MRRSCCGAGAVAHVLRPYSSADYRAHVPADSNARANRLRRRLHQFVLANAGGSQTAALQARYPQPNILIEDFIDFDSVMPPASVYATNGGYGGTMLALQHHLPMVAAGIHESKNEITARIGYFRVGVNLKTETPTVAQLRRAVGQVLADPQYKVNAQRLGAEFKQYDINRLCAQYIEALLYEQPVAATALAA